MRGKKTFGELFLTFLKIGAFTFGGGYAMIPLIQKEAVEKKRWIADKDLLDIVAIAESTPGPIAVNAATFVGYRVGGVVGAALATLGVVMPSFFIIVGVALALRRFQDIPAVAFAFAGIRAGVLALMVKAMIGMLRQCPKNPLTYAVGLAVFCSVAVFHCNILLVIAAAGVFGLISSVLMQKGGDK